eukprot:5259250-Pleurochrysis_carterae.AAC.1
MSDQHLREDKDYRRRTCRTVRCKANELQMSDERSRMQSKRQKKFLKAGQNDRRLLCVPAQTTCRVSHPSAA